MPAREDQFEAHRAHLRGVAYRMLGSLSDADDAVQETWLRLRRNGAEEVENLRAWLTTVAARVCLDMLRARAARREDMLAPEVEAATPAAAPDPEQEALLAESVGVALLVVLERLSPAERVAFVLHDVLGTPFEEVADITGRTPAAARQLASRARKRVRGGAAAARPGQPHAVVTAFLAALRAGDFEGLVATLHPEVVVRLQDAAAGGPREIRGAEQWARGALSFLKSAPAAAIGLRSARVSELVLVDGAPGLVWAPLGRLRRALRFKVAEGKITDVEVIADPKRLRQLKLTVLDET